jgi:ABC-type nitrate/sulfonate/bicarbonate transport system ATPase subunit
MYLQNEYVDRKVSLNLKNVSKQYLQPHTNRVHTVLEKINIQIFEGEIVTILGKSGCGKFTLLNLIADLEICLEVYFS